MLFWKSEVLNGVLLGIPEISVILFHGACCFWAAQKSLPRPAEIKKRAKPAFGLVQSAPFSRAAQFVRPSLKQAFSASYDVFLASMATILAFPEQSRSLSTFLYKEFRSPATYGCDRFPRIFRGGRKHQRCA